MAIDRRSLLISGAGLGALAVLGACGTGASAALAADPAFRFSDAEWRKRLGPAAYHVMREEGTEYAGSSPLLGEHRAGTFACAGCALPLFASRTKYDSHTGWPSFWAPLPHAVATKRDTMLGYTRTEVHCTRCAGHLGHVFDDGPPPTGQRYCMNGVALRFVPGKA